jgi:hypothetical protein
MQRSARVTNRGLAFIALGAVGAILAVQLVTFGIWGADGDPPDAVVAVAFTVFWGSILVLLGVGVVAIRRRRASRPR